MNRVTAAFSMRRQSEQTQTASADESFELLLRRRHRHPEDGSQQLRVVAVP
jgi:hypothetical protein